MGYRTLTEQDVIFYLQENVDFFDKDAQLTSKEIGDGNLNYVFHVKDAVSGKSVICKQALPYAKVVGESWPLTIDRSRIECEALRAEYDLCPDLVPKVYHFNQELALIVMEDLSDYTIMRKGLIQHEQYPEFPKQIGHFLAKTLFYTSDLAMDPFEKKKNVQKFTNPELCKITEDLVYTDPFYNAETNAYNPELEEDVKALWGNNELKLEVAELKKIFMTKAEALLHGDLHTGSIFVTKEKTKVIDPEFAYYGPMGYDVGALIANFLLNYNAQEGLDRTEEEKKATRDYLAQSVVDIWETFEHEFRNYWYHEKEDGFFNERLLKDYQDRYMKEVFEDTIGVAGLELIRRTIGLAHVADQESIQDPTRRALAERASLQLGEKLIMKRKEIGSIRNLVEFVANQTAVKA